MSESQTAQAAAPVLHLDVSILDQVVAATQADRTRSRRGTGEDAGSRSDVRHRNVRPQPRRHHRPGDRRDRCQAVGAVERDHASGAVPEAGRHLARPQSSRDEQRNRHRPEDPRAERAEARSDPRPDAGREFDQSQLFKKVYENEFGTPGGEPYGVLIGDYEWSASPEDVETLRLVSNVAAAGFTPFISAAGAKMFGFEDWTELSKPRDVAKIFESQEYTKWRSFRETRGQPLRLPGACRA